MTETHGILIYERLLSFAEYRKQSEIYVHQVLYDDVVKYLNDRQPADDREAFHTVIKLAHELSEIYVAGEHNLEEQGWREIIANELKEVYAIIALTKPKEFE